MKMKLLILVFAVITYSCEKMKQPEFRRLGNFNVKNLGLSKVDIAFRVTYFNPNSFGVSVKEAATDVYVDSVFVGKFVQEVEVKVDRNEEFSIPLVGSIPLSTALKLKVDDVTNHEFLINANGSVKVGKAGVFVTRPFAYKGKHQLNLKL